VRHPKIQPSPKGCAARQPRFYDFNVWSQTKFVEKLQYMHMNPAKRKLAAHRKDWPWSSFLFYAKKESGLIRIDPMR